MGHTPWPHQLRCLEAIENAYCRGVKRMLYVLPTGTGKTSTFLWAIDMFANKYGKRPAIVLAHRDELCQQAYDRVLAENPMRCIGMEKAERRASGDEDIIIASVQTLAGATRRKRFFEMVRPQVIIADESHHFSAKSVYRTIAEDAGCFKGECILIGCTATPKRTDKEALHSMDGTAFEEVVFFYGVTEATADGVLCEIKESRIKHVADLTGVHNLAGDFNKKELADTLDTDELNEAAYWHWKEVASDRQTIGFGCSVEHAHHLKDKWLEHGESVAVVDGTMDKQEVRPSIVRGFRGGDIQTLFNYGVATEGFDAPGISCVLVLRPTQSWGLYCQMVGRGTRISPGKHNVLVIDGTYKGTKHNLASVPAILDLPPDLDMEGHSLTEIKKKMDEFCEAAPRIIAKQPKSYTQLMTILEAVDAIDAVDTPPELHDITEHNWLKTAQGYLLSAGRDQRVWLKEDMIGNWQMEVNDETGVRSYPIANQPLQMIFQNVDAKIKKAWPKAGELIKRNARYRQEKPSEKQIRAMYALKVPRHVVEACRTKGQASNLISTAINNKEKR